jgi:hypothetical protein
LKPFKIDLAENIRLPDPDASPEKAIKLDVLREFG